MESKAPSTCRVCDISLASPSLWRQHAKSDWHVYNLRVKVAEPGAIITPPSSSPRRQTSAASSHRSESDDDAGDASDYESGDLECSTPAAVHFDPPSGYQIKNTSPRRRVFAFTVWQISQKSHKGLWTFTLADASPLDKTAAHGADSIVELQVGTQAPFPSS
ncbi:hypothetical protein MY5147_000839 [Beauveria neobassiana]